jgi:hypothetical protein
LIRLIRRVSGKTMLTRCSPRALLPARAAPLTPHPSPLTPHLSPLTPEPCQRAKLTHSALRCAPRERLGRAPWACGRGVRPLRTIPFLMRLCGFRLNSCSPQTGRQWGAFFLPDWRAAVIHADIRRALWLDVARGGAALGGHLVPYRWRRGL